MRTAFRLASVATLVAGAAVAAQQPPSTPTPTPPRNVRELVARAGRYVVDYGEKMSLLVGVERYSQSLRGAAAGQPKTRALVSEFALVRVADDWVGFRDVFEVDGVGVADRRDRLLTLLINRPADGLLEGRRIANESARYNLGALQRNFNTPTMALFFLHPKNQERFRYTKAGEDTIDGIHVWIVKYRETGVPTIVRTTTGGAVPASGMFWIDPTSGRVFRTLMELHAAVEQAGATDRSGERRELRQTAASITVSYKMDGRFGVPLPSEMRESYEVLPAHRAASQETPTTITCVATYGDFRTFETYGRVILR
jgi:hypothetical protein